jgi:hypothetical protein
MRDPPDRDWRRSDDVLKWTGEWTEFNAWLFEHDDRAVYRQAQEYAERVGNPSAVTDEYERLMHRKFRKWKRSQWWLRLLAPPELPDE